MKKAGHRSEAARRRLADEALKCVNHLYRVALHLARDPHEAEDLVQEAYVRALDSYQQFRPGTNIKAWLSRILYNYFLDHYHRKKRWIMPEGQEQVEDWGANFWDSLPGSEPSPERNVLDQELIGKLNEALSKIPEDFRAPIVLVDMGELTYLEAAEVLGCPLGTIRSRLSRGRKHLHKHLQGYMRPKLVKGGNRNHGLQRGQRADHRPGR